MKDCTLRKNCNFSEYMELMEYNKKEPNNLDKSGFQCANEGCDNFILNNDDLEEVGCHSCFSFNCSLCQVSEQ